MLVGVRVRVSKYDSNYGVSLDLPQYPNDNVASDLQSTHPITYLLLEYVGINSR